MLLPYLDPAFHGFWDKDLSSGCSGEQGKVLDVLETHNIQMQFCHGRIKGL
jgi:hypothetical protein